MYEVYGFSYSMVSISKVQYCGVVQEIYNLSTLSPTTFTLYPISPSTPNFALNPSTPTDGMVFQPLTILNI